MARYVLIALLTLAASGCVRIQFNLCEDDPPHPDCPDAAVDAAVDAGPDAAVDAAPDLVSDGGNDAG